MKEETILKIGETLDITKTNIKALLKTKRYQLLSSAIAILVAFIAGNNYFLGMHYIGVSIRDFGWFMRFF